MPVYAYRGLSTQGRATSGVVDAESPRAARAKLRRQGIFATRLAEEQRRARPPWVGLLDRVRSTEIAATTRQLATLVGAGLPLVEALGVQIEQCSSPRLKRALSQAREQVVEGRPFADALRDHPGIFPAVYVNLVQAGEASGSLDVVLERLAAYSEDQARLSHRIRSALAYPAIMAVIGSAILVFLVTYVVPQVLRVFEEKGQALPLLTRTLLVITNGLARYWWVLALAAAAATVAARAALRRPGGRMLLDRLKLRLPVFGPLGQRIAVARLTRTLATLLRSGVPLLQALDIAKSVLTNRVLAAAVEAARDAIREGQSIAPPLSRSRVFPPMVVQMIAVGERTGTLEDMLVRIADAYDREAETTVSTLTTLLEPLMIVFMGLVVLFIVLAVLQPIFQLNRLLH